MVEVGFRDKGWVLGSGYGTKVGVEVRFQDRGRWSRSGIGTGVEVRFPGLCQGRVLRTEGAGGDGFWGRAWVSGQGLPNHDPRP